MAVLEAHRLPLNNLTNPKINTYYHPGQSWQKALLQDAMNPPVGGLPSSNFHANLPPLNTITQEGSAGGKKRKAAKPKPIGELRRVASTPQIRGISMNEQIPPSPTAADKRRSKLGYHRSSVACTHCRKRKIRCVLPTPPDALGRCSHCIRLKKECKFEGVNESSPIEPKVKRSGPPSVSDPSSPQTSSHASGLQEDSEQIYPIAHALEGSSDPDTQLDPGFNGVPLYHEQQRRYAYPPPVGAEGWSQDGITSPTASTPYHRDDPTSPYWSSTQVTHPAAFHPANPATAMSNPGTYTRTAYPSQAGASAWSAQPRSMSLGHVEHIHQQYPYQETPHFAQQQHPDQRAQYSPQVAPVGQQMGLPPPPQAGQAYPYQHPDWQRYQMAGADPNARDRSAYQYPNQYYSTQAQPQGEAMPPPPNVPYANPSAYYPPSTQRD